MALRRIRLEGEEILRKKSKEVNEITDRIIKLLDDMAETMYANDGIGLAAPQVGVLRRMIVIDIKNGKGLIKLINPRIISEEGEQNEIEGCLSIPGVYAEVKRPLKVIVNALNEKGEEVEIVGEGLLSVALCHEIDHLDGILFKDKINPKEEKVNISKG